MQMTRPIPPDPPHHEADRGHRNDRDRMAAAYRRWVEGFGVDEMTRGTNTCAMCAAQPADHGMMCAQCRADDLASYANDNRAPVVFSDDVDPAARDGCDLATRPSK